MKVSKLIEILKSLDKDQEVTVVTRGLDGDKEVLRGISSIYRVKNVVGENRIVLSDGEGEK